ncbi:MAG: molybdopterin-synthase adenylyltransferase MoeB [Gammaproteobacteria bacterium]|nr:molybdopterin-synthase adenylyltransferase MoeB [Gammaproteobacteria bacterium]
MLPDNEARYSRQIKLSSIGPQGQQKILQSTALIIGMGGLGSPCALYMAAAGIGKLIICDFDVVESSNLQRQIIHRQDQVGELKVHSARASILALNPECKVETIAHEMDHTELEQQIHQADIVIDCSDNFPTRFALNRYCVSTKTPLVSAAAIRLEGQILNYIPDTDGPCYQCLYSSQYENAQSCEMEGVLGPVVGVMGTLQALDALLILTGNFQQLVGKLLLFDGLNMQWQQVQVPRNPSCPICSH